jgi:hypothetical protein
MRNFSIISILLALAIVGFLWQKSLEKNSPENLLETIDRRTTVDDQYTSQDFVDCDEQNQESSSCEPEMETSEQDEMADQQSRGHDVMMKSFNDGLSQYKGTIKGAK